jgi:hypothetical protein
MAKPKSNDTEILSSVLAREAGTIWLEAACIARLASVARINHRNHDALNRYKTALHMLESLQAASDHLTKQNMASLRRDLIGDFGAVCHELGRHDEARELVSRALKISRR